MGMKSQYRSAAARIGTAFMMAGAIFFCPPGDSVCGGGIWTGNRIRTEAGSRASGSGSGRCSGTESGITTGDNTGEFGADPAGKPDRPASG